jgi:hypothetical protein
VAPLRRLRLVNAHTGETFDGPFRDDLGPLALALTELSDFLRDHNVADINPGASVGLHIEWDQFVGPMPITLLGRWRQNVDGDRGAQADLRATALGVAYAALGAATALAPFLLLTVDMVPSPALAALAERKTQQHDPQAAHPAANTTQRTPFQ